MYVHYNIIIVLFANFYAYYIIMEILYVFVRTDVTLCNLLHSIFIIVLTQTKTIITIYVFMILHI